MRFAPQITKGFRIPEIKQLDKASTITDTDKKQIQIPVNIMDISGHVSYVNTAYLKCMNIDPDKKQSTDPVGVVRINDKATGELDEFANDAAFSYLMTTKVIDQKDLLGYLVEFGELAVSKGVTTLVDALVEDSSFYDLYGLTIALGQFPVRISLYPTYSLFEQLIEKGVQPRQGSDFLQCGPVKFITDGSNQGHTGYLKSPFYYDTQQQGNFQPNITLQQLQDQLLNVHVRGWQAAMHTNGDLATENAITAVKYVQEQHYRPDHRHRLEHNQLASESQLQLMSDLDIYTDLFANHINVFGDYHLEVAFGADRANRLDPVASALKYKIKTSLHCDGPVTVIGPLFSVQNAVLRQTSSGITLGANQCISVQDALELVTLGGARLLFQDNVKGSIEVGKFADFAILEANPLTVNPSTISSIPVYGTVVAGVFHKTSSKINHQ